MKKKVLLKGPILSQSGYGCHAREVFRSLVAHEDHFDIYLTNINWGQTGFIVEDNEERRMIDSLLQKTTEYVQNGGKFDIFLHCTIPNEFERQAPINIGITAGIETTKISPQWVEKSQLVDKILTVSEHSKYGFVNSKYDAKNAQTGEVLKNFSCRTPVEVIGYAARNYEPAPINHDFASSFNFLAVAQWGPRKNITKLVEWFVEENIDQPDVGLILKLNIRSNSVIDLEETKKRLLDVLSKYPERKCQIYLLHGDMTDGEMSALYSHPKVKALVSLSPEGYGLPLQEAACHGLPIVTIGWGGPCDFLFAPVKKGAEPKAHFAEVEYDLRPIPKEAVWDGVLVADSMWAYPKAASFKMRIREVRREYKRFLAQAKRLQKKLLSDLQKETIYKKYAEAILGEKIVSVPIQDLPKISIVTSMYKGAEYLEGFLQSITSQTIFTEKCELILINANSPEREEEEKILAPYLEKFSNIKYTALSEDPGIYGAWNLAIEQATGEFITNANLDDRRAANCIEKCAKELFLSPEMAGVYFDQLITQVPNETFEKNSSNGRKYNFPEFSFEALKYMSILHAMPCWRKSLHEKHGMFDSQYRSAGDWELFLRCASKGEKFKKLPEVLGLYYFSPRGLSTDPANNVWKRAEEKSVYSKYKDLHLEQK